MGIFADRCHALIDPTTKRALAGEALEKARLDPKWPRCGNRVKKAAKFCGKCGSPAPKGWMKCPQCGKWVGGESQFCWNCKAALRPEHRPLIESGRWQKDPLLLAQRLEVGNIREFLHKGKIFIDTGTSALLLEGGKFVDILPAGTHTLESLGRKLNNWGDPPPRTVILIDSGDIALPLRIEDLRAAENIPVELYTEAALRFSGTDKAARAFIENVMKTDYELSYEKFAELLTSEIVYAAKNACTKSTINELFKDPDRRLHLDQEIQSTLKQAEERYGFEVVRVAVAEFTGAAYEELLQKEGDIELKRRHLEFDRQLRDLLSREKMDKFKSETDLEEYIAQLAHERGISTEHRQHETALLKQVYRQELDSKEAAWRMDQETAATEHELGITRKRDDFGREKAVLDERTDDEVERSKTAREADAAREWLKVRADKEELARKDLAERAKIVKELDIQALIAVLPDAAARDQMLELYREQLKAGRKPEEILAQAADRSPEAAKALAEMARRSREELEKEFDERKKLTDAQSAQLERVLKSALETTAEAAKRPGSSAQIVK